MTKPLALTSGEPAGIGPDITIKAWLCRDELKLPAFYLLGDPGFLAQRAKALGLDLRLAEVQPEQASDTFPNALPVVATGPATAQPGTPDGTSADAAMASIRQAVGDVIAGRASACLAEAGYDRVQVVLADAEDGVPGGAPYKIFAALPALSNTNMVGTAVMSPNNCAVGESVIAQWIS